MSASKMNFYEKLIDGYVKFPPSLKEQAINRLAILLCQDNELKKDISYESEPLRRCKYLITNCKWDNFIEKRSANICESLPLPPAVKQLLIVRIGSIALQLFSWNRKHIMINFSPLSADDFSTPSDWTLEMILDEKKIVERFTQDEKIPVFQRYIMACLHCLQSSVHSLWDQISPESREDLIHHEESALVRLWSCQVAERKEELLRSQNQFWHNLFNRGLCEGSRSTVFHCWDKFSTNVRQRLLVNAAMYTVTLFHHRSERESPNSCMYLSGVSLSTDYTDILCFLLTQMSKEQMVSFFQKVLEDSPDKVLLCFIRWPYLDLLVPTIKKLWNILPEASYEYVLVMLAIHYSKVTYTINVNRGGYVDYDYGDAMIKLLEEAPDHFKRFVFSNNFPQNTHYVEEGQLLFVMISKYPLQIRNIKVFQRIWQHVKLEEKRSFLRSTCGKLLCYRLALYEKWELLNSIVRECLPEKDIAIFRKRMLTSEEGKDVCLEMLTRVNDDAFNSWLNWGFLSKKESFQFILKLFFKNNCFRFEKVSDFNIEINCLDNIIERYVPSQEAGRKFKTKFVKTHSRNVCIYFIKHSKWQEVDQFLDWGFPSERARKRFKDWFVRGYAMFLCEHHMRCPNLQDAEKFLTWCFPSEEAKEQFRQELFFFSGIMLQWIFYWYNAWDIDILTKWFQLGPEAMLKFKKEVLFRSNALNSIFNYMSNLGVANKNNSDEILERTRVLLRWGLTAEETAMSFKDASKMHLVDYSFSSIEVRQLVEQHWDKLICEILADLSIERKDIENIPN